jgi:hypothetical protein
MVLFMKWRVISAGNDTGMAGADREESCGETAKVSPFKAEKPEEVRRIDEDLPRLAEAGIAAELAPDGCGLGKVAGGDVVPDLVPFGRRQYRPQGLVRPHEAVEICGLILVDPAIPGVHVRRPDPTMLGVMAAITLPGLADMVIDRRARLLGPEGLVRETIAMVAADPSRIDATMIDAHVQLMRERENLGRQNSRAFLQAIRSLGLRMADPRFWARMRKIEAPALVIHGELDRLIPLSAARDLARRHPDWTFEVIDGVGHVPMMETPNRFLEVVNQWLMYRIAPEPATVS